MDIQFSNEQQVAFNKYVEGHNIFITGPGGTGKTALIRHIYADAHKKGVDIQVCALTGCAAVLLECKATTLHSWSRIGLGNGSIENMVERIQNNSFAKSCWRTIDILVIDEVSMMSQKLFEMLNAIGKAVRRNARPFGGIQLIFSGDFYQLPPVGNKEEPETMRFCFESPLWGETFQSRHHVCLYTIFRQTDLLYQRILNQIREGRLKRSSNEILLQQVEKKVSEEYQIRPTKLFPTRKQVDRINFEEMHKLSGPEYTYSVKRLDALEMAFQEKKIRSEFTKDQIELELNYLQGNLRCDDIVKLKVGTQVMCIVNISVNGNIVLCNGSQGIVTDFKMACVAFTTQPQLFPVVQFTDGYVQTMGYYIWPSETIPGVGVAQIPLILAWALTIHKSQGATLDIAEIDAGSGIFECGQTYVALSRVKSLEGLYLSSFNATRVKINKKVQDFYEKLENEQLAQQSESLIQSREIERLPEAYVETSETTNIPVAVAVPITAVPITDNSVEIYPL